MNRRMRRAIAFSSSLVLHIIALVVLNAAAARALTAHAGAGAARNPITVIVMPPADASSIPGLNSTGDDDDAALIRPFTQSSEVDVPGFRYNVGRIRDRARLLFPFLTPGLALERFGLQPQREAAPAASPTWNTDARVVDPPKPPAPALTLSSAALQLIIDQAWSRRDRWNVFDRIAALADTYSADSGQLAQLFHKYVDQNALQPYVDTAIRDPRLWTELGIAADHVVFIGFISRYVTEHPSTRGATELLFLLDKIAEGSLEVLLTLLQSEPTEQLRWTRQANSAAYNLLLDLRRFYTAQLSRRGLASADDIRHYYENVRLAILTSIVRSAPDGYRASDARFLIGAIHWRRGDTAAALKWWRDMTDGDPDDSYAAARSRMLRIINAPEGVDRRQVDMVLRNVHGAWLMFSIDRLSRFGYRLDTY